LIGLRNWQGRLWQSRDIDRCACDPHRDGPATLSRPPVGKIRRAALASCEM